MSKKGDFKGQLILNEGLNYKISRKGTALNFLNCFIEWISARTGKK
jgi:hypothetical protein